MRDTGECMSEWLECPFRRVVFDLHTSQKVEETRIDLHARARQTGNRRCLVFEVSGKIALDAKIARKISGSRHLESVKAFALIDNVIEGRVFVGKTGIDPVMRETTEELEFLVVRLRRGNRGAGKDDRPDQDSLKHRLFLLKCD